MDAVLLAILSGFVGAVGERLLHVLPEIRLNDRKIRERDASLRQWVADEDVRLSRELRRITNTMAAQGQLYAGSHARARASAKELALHRWRDERERAERERGAIKDSETVAHKMFRRFGSLPTLTAFDDDRLLRTVEEWQEDEALPGGPPIRIVNPANRTLAPSTLAPAIGPPAGEPELIFEGPTPNGGRRFVFHLDAAERDEAGNPDPAFVREYEWGPFSPTEPPMSTQERESMSDEEFERRLPEIQAYSWEANRREAAWLADSDLRRLRGLPAKTYEGHPPPPWR